MIDSPLTSARNQVNNSADAQIQQCLSLARPVSFFLFAGAGSGKTRSLVDALKHVREHEGRLLRLHGRRVGVITYTNAACDEIQRRLEHDPLFSVSTIHRFVWDLINGFNSDIRGWLKTQLEEDIRELTEELRKGRPGTKTETDRKKRIASKGKRLERLPQIKQFTYSPDGDNLGRDSLNHSEVIKMGTDFLAHRPVMQSILVNKFPILLIDECQDTNKHLMEAFLNLQQQNRGRFSLGLFGDTMQRIYSDGKLALGQNLPDDWIKPVKDINYRCPVRVVTLINRIRSAVDEQKQLERPGKPIGHARLFVLPNEGVDKSESERRAAQRMAEITGDALWVGDGKGAQKLILEHKMAARRMGFAAMYEPLSRMEKMQIGLRTGEIPELRLFSERVLPLIRAQQRGDGFAVMAIVRAHSPLLTKESLQNSTGNQLDQIKQARQAVQELCELWSTPGGPTFLEVLISVSKTSLFEIPEALRPITLRTAAEQATAASVQEKSPGDEKDIELDTWDEFLRVPFAQIEPYKKYTGGEADYSTHQGVKGREFPRVMVIIDDSEAGGFLFSYEALFGAKELSTRNRANAETGAETSIDRTRRLFYVTCSRAEESLAVVAYSSNPEKVRAHVLREGWFEAHEVEVLR